MKALILAAGRGERLGLVNRAKVQENFLGLSLLERAILSAREAGVRDFYIVVGYRGEEVIDALGDGARLGVRLNYLRNERWQEGNGRSVLAAKDAVDGNFFLLMGDHVFDPNILKRLSKVEISEGCAICIDSNLSTIFDLPEATKVLVENGNVRSIGKDLENYNGIDCGVFLCTREIFDAMGECFVEGKNELSNAIERLAKKNKVKAIDISGNFWFDIDSPQDLREAKRRMLKSLASPQDGIISRHLNRRISARISSFLVNWNIRPNVLSFLAFIIGALAALFCSFGDYFPLVMGGILAQACSILDGCDGEVARLKFLRSNYGAWLDSVLDRYVDGLLILGLTYGCWRFGGGSIVLVIGLLALVGSFGVSYTRARYESAFASSPPTGLGIPVRRDGRLFLIMVGALLNQVLVMLAILAILTNAENIRRLIWWRKAPIAQVL